MTIQDSPWARFLGARADMIAKLRGEGESDEAIRRTLSMDLGQVGLIAATPLKSIVCTSAWLAERSIAAVPEPSPRQQGGGGRDDIALEWARDVIAELQGYGVAIDPARRELIADCDAQLLKCQFLDATTSGVIRVVVVTEDVCCGAEAAK